MASYRPFPAPQQQPNQNPLQQPPQQQRPQPPPSQYGQNYPASQMAPPPLAPPPPAQQQPYTMQQNFSQHYQHQPPPPPQYQYQPPPPPPPPPESSYPPPPPPPAPTQQPPAPSLYFPSSQYSQYGQQPMQQPLPPPPPPSSSIPPPPPPPPSSPPPPPPKDSGMQRDKGVVKDRREPGHSNHGGVGRNHHHHQQQKVAPSHQLPPMGRKVGGPSGRVETEEERRMRKKREVEKQRQEEKHRHQMKESQNSVLQKTQLMASQKGHGSIAGSRMGDRRATPLLGGERIENRLKKPTTFLCKLKFRNELPDPSAQPKLMALKRDKDRFTKYRITSLEKMYKPQLFVEPDLGIPLDLLDLSVYNPPRGVKLPLAPEDEELLRDDEAVTPVKREGIKRKERPTDKGVAWLVKTQYISPLSMESAKMSLTEKQAKELREIKGGRNVLDNLNNRERHIKEIQASFEASKLRPIHATNKRLHPVEILPLVPDFDRFDDKFVTVTFDGAPTADSEIYGKLDQSIRNDCEARAIMKACVATGSDPTKPEKFLGYMAPNPNELFKDMYDENEDISYSWIREYHWDVRGDDANDPSTFLVSFDESEARYLPLPTKINLRKKRARDGRTGEVEHFPAPSRITARLRSTAATIEVKDSGPTLNSRAGAGKVQRVGRSQDVDHYSDAEDDMSE